MKKRGVLARSLAARFWSKVDLREWEPGACCAWGAATNAAGYGVLNSGGHNGRPLLAHRVSWEIHNGPIPADGPPPHGWVVEHTCDNPQCVNPTHLRLGTYRSNAADMCAKGRQARGAKQGGAKLTADAVHTLLAALASGATSIAEAAATHGVSTSTIYKIVSGERWAHVTGNRQ